MIKIGQKIKQKLKNFTYLKTAFSIIWDSSKKYTIINIIIITIQSLLPLILLYLTKQIIDNLTIALQGNSNSNLSFNSILVLIFLVGLVTLIDSFAGVINNLTSEIQGQIIIDYVQKILHQKSVEVDLEYYENHQYYDAFHQVQTEAPVRPMMIFKTLTQLCLSTISLIGIGFLLLSLDWVIIFILIFAALPTLIVKLKYADKIYQQWRKLTPEDRKAHYLHGLLTEGIHAKEIRLFNLGKIFQRQYNQLRTHIRNSRIGLAKGRTSGELVTQGTATLAVSIVTGVIAWKCWQGLITVGSLVMYYQAFQKGLKLLKDTLSSLAGLYENSLFLGNLQQFLALKPLISSPVNPRNIPHFLQTGIKFEDIFFYYPHINKPILQGINLEIKAGETVALVGKNGAGKTSLVKLICRLYDPNSGNIYLDGINLKEFNPLDLRQQISVVFQDYSHYNLTVRENIGFGNLALIENKQKLTEAVQFSGVDTIMKKLNSGFDSILGNEFAEGAELSIGEWQKIAIARAYLRDSQILLLDEPTSALDPQAEAEILSKFAKLTENRTSLIVTHRLSSLKFVDRIIVLENGKINEQGTHQELIKLNGTYAYLFNTQAQFYTTNKT